MTFHVTFRSVSQTFEFEIGVDPIEQHVCSFGNGSICFRMCWEKLSWVRDYGSALGKFHRGLKELHQTQVYGMRFHPFSNKVCSKVKEIECAKDRSKFLRENFHQDSLSTTYRAFLPPLMKAKGDQNVCMFVCVIVTRVKPCVCVVLSALTHSLNHSPTCPVFFRTGIYDSRRNKKRRCNR